MAHFDVVTGTMVEDDPVVGSAAPLPVSPPPAAPAPVTVPSAAPALSTAPVDPALTIDKQTVTGPSTVDTSSKPTVTGKIVDAGMLAADQKVSAAEAANRKALELEAKNNLTKAEIAGKDLDLEHARKTKEAEDARAQLASLAQRQADMEKQATAQQAAYQAEADRNKRGYFKDQDTATKVLWGISLLFGAGATRYGKENSGMKLLDKAMDDWSAASQQRLARLMQQSERSGGLLAKFMEDHGAESQQQLQLRIAAGYASVAGDIRKQIDARKGLMTSEAQGAALAKVADFESKAAEARQKVVDARAQTRTSGGGSTSTTQGGGSVVFDGNDKSSAKTLFDLKGQPVGKALSKEEGEKIRAAQGATNGLLTTLDRLKKFNTENGTWNISPTKTQERSLLIGNATAYLTQAFQTGTLQQAEFDRYSKMLAGSALQRGADSAKGLETLAEGMRNAYDAKVASQGIAVKPSAGDGGVRKLVNGKPAMVYPDGTMEAL